MKAGVGKEIRTKKGGKKKSGPVLHQRFEEQSIPFHTNLTGVKIAELV